MPDTKYAITRRLRGFGFHRLQDGVWVRKAGTDRGYYSTDPGMFWAAHHHRPVIAVSVLDAYNVNVTLYYRGKGTPIVRNASRQAMAAAIQKLLNNHRVRGRLNNWWHHPA